MGRKRHTPEQTIHKLRQAVSLPTSDGTPLTAVQACPRVSDILPYGPIQRRCRAVPFPGGALAAYAKAPQTLTPSSGVSRRRGRPGTVGQNRPPGGSSRAQAEVRTYAAGHARAG